ncbi:MAG TPA: acyltransferase [Polyangiales bacterium]
MPLETTADRGKLLHFRSLDGLRAIAVSAVLLFHVGECWQEPLQATAVGRLAFRVSDLGYAGVDLFFVLSGFLITGILVSSRGRTGYFRSFYARRTLRIFPLYYVFLALLAAVALSGAIRGAREFLADLPWYALYLTNVKFMRDSYTSFAPVQHLWSLAIEEQFYLVWPAVVAWLAPRRLLGVSVLAVLAVWILRALWVHHGASPVAVYVGTPTRLDTLLLGACLALARDEPWVDRAAPYIMGVGALACGLLLARLHGLAAGDPPVQTYGFAALAVLFTGMIASCVAREARGGSLRMLALPSVQRIGKLSYGIYIFHWPVVLSVSALVSRFVPGGLPGFALSCVLSGLASYGLASLSYRLLEAPLLALKDRYPRPA